MKSSRIRKINVALAAVVLGIASSGLNAAQIYWADWQGSNIAAAGQGFQGLGTITTGTTALQVTYTNRNGIGFYQSTGGTDYWTGGSGTTSPYTSAAVDNRPTGTDIIALSQAGNQTLQFSQTVANPVFAFASLNGNGYAFNRDFDLLSLGGENGNACGYWGCGGASKVVVDLGGGVFEYQLNSNGVGGSEPHGTLQFKGSFDTLTWRSATNEYWNGFTVGVQGTAAEVFPVNSVPEPGLLTFFGLALLTLTGLKRKAK